jgi:uncharacterized membrane protein
MGGVGSILVLLSFVPFIGFLFGLADLVMVLLAVKRISEAVKDREIFHNVLMAVILQIVVMAVLGSLLAGLVAMWITLIIAARFLRKGYEGIADKTGTETFRKVGRWYYYGTWLAIVLVGFVLILIAAILQIVAFFSLPESPPSQPTPQVQTI